MTSQTFESYLPVYDTVPENWEEAKPFFVEQLKKISNLLNEREIGFMLEEELLTGKSFTGIATNPNEFRTVFRMVVDCSPLVVGANAFPHNIQFDSNFTLVDIWVAGTDSVGLTASVITDNNVTMDSTNVNITSIFAYDRAYCVIEYLKEI